MLFSTLKLNFLSSCAGVSRQIRRGFSSPPENNEYIRKLRLTKRILATVLFGGTFATVIYFKHKRTNELKLLLEDAQRLPSDVNFSNLAQDTFRYKGYILAKDTLKAVKELATFEARSDDIYVVSFPKSGTTWVQEIVYLVVNNLNFEKAQASVLENRFPYLEYQFPGWKSLTSLNCPTARCIKSHLPYSLLPQSIKDRNCKIIYVTRNPKDVLISSYFFNRMMKFLDYKGSLKEYFEKFLNDEVFYGPFWKHVLEFWKLEDSNTLFLKYEDLQRNIAHEIKKIGAFLGKDLTDQEVSLIAEHCSFSSMSKNPATNYSHWTDFGLRNKDEAQFMRKGITGDWKNYFQGDMNDRVEEWVQSHFENSGLVFEYDISSSQEKDTTV